METQKRKKQLAVLTAQYLLKHIIYTVTPEAADDAGGKLKDSKDSSLSVG